jgi:hypothetical protein
MAAHLLSPRLVALDSAGDPISGARAYFYDAGTTAHRTVYTSAAMNLAHPQPVLALADGSFPPIYYEASEPPRMVLRNAAGAPLANGDVDPVGGTAVVGTDGLADGAVTGDKLDADAVADSLGFSPLNKAGDTATDLALTHVTPTAASAGYLGAPVNQQNAAYALVLSDAGKTIKHTDTTPRTYTVPPSSGGGAVAFADETYVVIRNVGTGAVTISRGTGVALLGEGSGVDKNWTLAQHGKAVISKHAGDIWYIAGSGLS